MRFKEPPPSQTRSTIKADPFGDPDEMAAKLEKYREDLELPENFILKSQRSFEYED